MFALSISVLCPKFGGAIVMETTSVTKDLRNQVSTRGPLKRALLLGGILLLGYLFFRGAILDLNAVPTATMKPSLQPGDRIVVNRLEYGLRIPLTDLWIWRRANPQRGEIVVLVSPQDGRRVLKRVVALPGETIEVRGNGVIIDGVESTYSQTGPSFAPWLDRTEHESAKFLFESVHEVRYPIGILDRAPSISHAPLKVPAESYFVLGDTRNNSLDSRSFGVVPLAAIIGKATHVRRKNSGSWDILQPVSQD